MNIVYTFDDGYTEITGVSMISLLENNKESKEITFYIIDFGISDSAKSKLIDIVSKYRRNINFIKTIDLKERIPVVTVNRGWSPICYVRLFFAEMLSDNIDRIIHIDCDTIINSNLASVYDYELGDNFCAACYDCTPRPKHQADFSKSDKYISNGLILIDLKKWREKRVGDSFVDYIIKKNGNLPHLDQDVLNAVLKGKILILPAKYNVMPLTFMYGSLCCELFMNEPYYSKDEINEAVSNPVMIHFTGSRYTRRPWQQPCMHWYNAAWIEYYQKADYSIYGKLIKPNKSIVVQLKSLYARVWIYACRIEVLRKLRFNMDRKFLWKI